MTDLTALLAKDERGMLVHRGLYELVSMELNRRRGVGVRLTLADLERLMSTPLEPFITKLTDEAIKPLPRKPEGASDAR